MESEAIVVRIEGVSRGELDQALSELFPEVGHGQIGIHEQEEELGFDPTLQTFLVSVASGLIVNAITAAVASNRKKREANELETARAQQTLPEAPEK